MKFFLILTILVFSCKTPPTKTAVLVKDPQEYKQEGWLNQSTFQVVGDGQPIEETRGFIRRRFQAKQKALDNAKKKGFELIIKNYMENIQNNKTISDLNKKLKNNIMQIIDYGEMTYEFYDDRDYCTVTYTIYKNNLSNIVQKVFLKYN